MSDIIISKDKTKLDIEVIHNFLKTSYWAADRTKAEIEISIENSLCFGVYLDNQQIGLARVVSDRIVFAYVMDVFILDGFQAVWDLLTNPEMTQQYMFGCALIADWIVGSTVDWKGKTEDGTEIVYVTGKVLEYEEGKKVISTTFDPNSGMKDIPENHIHLTYELRSVDAGTILTITQGDFSKAENGKQRYEESESGWVDLVIPLMKKLLDE